MVANKRHTVLYRRKREKRTNYKKRLRLLLSQAPRLVVRFTNQRIIAQVVEFTATGDQVITATDSFALRKIGWNHSCKNLPAAYLTGLSIGKKAVGKDVGKVVLDTGFMSVLHKGRVFAFLKGVIDAGLEVPYGDESVFPAEERIKGEHLKSANSAAVPAAFEKVKQAIIG